MPRKLSQKVIKTMNNVDKINKMLKKEVKEQGVVDIITGYKTDIEDFDKIVNKIHTELKERHEDLEDLYTYEYVSAQDRDLYEIIGNGRETEGGDYNKITGLLIKKFLGKPKKVIIETPTSYSRERL